MLYQLHEFQRAMLSSLTAWAQAASKSFANPSSPFSLMPGATRMAAAYELMYRLGKDYEKPEFNIHQIVRTATTSRSSSRRSSRSRSAGCCASSVIRTTPTPSRN